MKTPHEKPAISISHPLPYSIAGKSVLKWQFKYKHGQNPLKHSLERQFPDGLTIKAYQPPDSNTLEGSAYYLGFVEVEGEFVPDDSFRSAIMILDSEIPVQCWDAWFRYGKVVLDYEWLEPFVCIKSLEPREPEQPQEQVARQEHPRETDFAGKFQPARIWSMNSMFDRPDNTTEIEVVEEFQLRQLSAGARRMAEAWIMDDCYDLVSGHDDLIHVDDYTEDLVESDIPLLQQIQDVVRRSGATNLRTAEYIINLEARLARLERKMERS
jgi:hypothetical protein